MEVCKRAVFLGRDSEALGYLDTDAAMSPIRRFTIDAGPGTLWKVQVVLWPNRKALLKARGDGSQVDAFCKQFDPALAVTTGVVAEIHFSRRGIQPKIVVHEAVHAAIAHAGIAKLDLNTHAGDEQFAECVEHLFAGITWALKKRK